MGLRWPGGGAKVALTGLQYCSLVEEMLICASSKV